MSNLLMASVHAHAPNPNIPALQPGDTVRVHTLIVEGEKERVQVFQGINRVPDVINRPVKLLFGIRQRFPDLPHEQLDHFVTLLLLVKMSNGVFTVTWLLDGRRKRLADDQEILGETRPTVAPMAMQLGGPQQAMVQPPAVTRSPLSAAVEVRDRAIVAMVDALRELMRRIGDTKDDAERARLREAHKQLTEKYDELVALRLKDVLESEAVRSALAKLDVITAELAAGAQEMKATADALATAAKMIDRATKAIGFLGAMFA